MIINNKILDIKMVNARSFIVNTGNFSEVEILNNTLYANGNKVITINETLPYEDKSYKIKLIEKVDKSVVLHTHDRTKSSYYLMPLLGKSEAFFKFHEYLINCHLVRHDSKVRLGLLYRFSNDTNYLNFEKELTKLPNFICHKDVDTDTVMYLFSIYKEDMEIVDLFKEGKFSKFNNTYKKKIIGFHALKNESKIFKVLYKDKDLSRLLACQLGVDELPEDIDLVSKPDLTLEYYDLL